MVHTLIMKAAAAQSVLVLLSKELLMVVVQPVATQLAVCANLSTLHAARVALS